MIKSIFTSKNADFVTANTTLFRIIDAYDIYYRIVPVQKEAKVALSLKKRKLTYWVVRAYNPAVLAEFVEKVQHGRIRGEEIFEYKETWRQVGMPPFNYKNGKIRDGKYFLHNGKVAKYEGGCLGCGGDTYRVQYCHVDRRIRRFCCDDCMESYGRYLRKTGK